MLLKDYWEVNLYKVGYVVSELAMTVTDDVQLKIFRADLVWQDPLIKVSESQSHVLSDLFSSHPRPSIDCDLIYIYRIDGLSIVFFKSIGNRLKT